MLWPFIQICIVHVRDISLYNECSTFIEIIWLLPCVEVWRKQLEFQLVGNKLSLIQKLYSWALKSILEVLMIVDWKCSHPLKLISLIRSLTLICPLHIIPSSNRQQLVLIAKQMCFLLYCSPIKKFDNNWLEIILHFRLLRHIWFFMWCDFQWINYLNLAFRNRYLHILCVISILF